jgi:hypothetical protein
MRELLSRAYVQRAERLLSDIKALIDAHWAANGPSPGPGLISAIEQDLAEMRKP